jgi:hypothetical protein
MRRILKISVVTAAIVLGAAAPAMATTVNVGGGTWNYGTSYVFPVSEGVYSDYYHPTNHHSGTSICAANNVTVHANAGSWANSSTSCGYGGATHAYWNNND